MVKVYFKNSIYYLHGEAQAMQASGRLEEHFFEEGGLVGAVLKRDQKILLIRPAHQQQGQVRRAQQWH